MLFVVTSLIIVLLTALLFIKKYNPFFQIYASFIYIILNEFFSENMLVLAIVTVVAAAVFATEGRKKIISKQFENFKIEEFFVLLLSSFILLSFII